MSNVVTLPASLKVEQDSWTDTVSIEGIRYSRELFRQHAVCVLGSAYRVVNRNDGALTLQDISEAVRRIEDDGR